MIANELNTKYITSTSIYYIILTRHQFMNTLRVQRCFLYDKDTNIEIIFDTLNIDHYIHL